MYAVIGQGQTANSSRGDLTPGVVYVEVEEEGVEPPEKVEGLIFVMAAWQQQQKEG